MFYGHVLWSNDSKIGQMTVKGCFMRSNDSKIGQMTVKQVE